MSNKSKINKTEVNKTINFKEVSSRHIKDFRKNERKWTQATLAEKTGFETITVGRCERAEKTVSEKFASALSELSGYIVEYWLGLTECKTDSEYDEELKRMGEAKRNEQIALAERQRENRKTLLSLCGFVYEDLFSPTSTNKYVEMTFKDCEDSSEYRMITENKSFPQISAHL